MARIQRNTQIPLLMEPMGHSEVVLGTWNLQSVSDGDVRLRSGSVGLMSAQASAPVRHGRLIVEPQRVHLDIVIALDKIKMGNFVMQAAARTLISMHKVHDLTFAGSGSELSSVHGIARAGDVEVDLDLALSVSESLLHFNGQGSLGTVHIPIPGLGTIDDFRFDVEASVGLLAQRDYRDGRGSLT